MASTFGGQTLTQTGQIGQDTIDPNDQYLGFGNLITQGGSAINSTTPFQNKSVPSGAPPKADYTKIKGQDVKLVHGDRWQELEAFMTENVQKDFKTTIGLPPTISSGDSSGDLDYNDPKDDQNTTTGNPIVATSDGVNLPLDPGDGGEGGLPPSSTDEKTQVDPGKGQAKYILDVRGDQKTAIGGNVSLWVAGYNDTVQIGQFKASYFSQYITNTGDSQYHNTPDSYVTMNNDYKIVYNTKYRNVHMKQDIAQMSLGLVEYAKLEFKFTQVASALASLSLGGANLGFWLMANDAFAIKSLVAACHAKAAPSVNAAPTVNPSGCHFP
ncbi:MAG TPA: hypothetical protein VMB85_18675 [Bryobacteraceae bacterium]|jgi:hypothetical protein|nr:hypothetical protein [Bryobacteraceae bacterium]